MVIKDRHFWLESSGIIDIFIDTNENKTKCIRSSFSFRIRKKKKTDFHILATLDERKHRPYINQLHILYLW